MFAENTEYEIMTPSGWKNFKGITRAENKKTFKIRLEDNSFIESTANHYFFKDNKKVQLKDLTVGNKIDTINGSQEIVDISFSKITAVYDIVEVEDELHRFVINDGIVTKNCDEFAYVRPTIAREFWTSISPTLATGGKAIITSTPNSDEDQFAFLWKGANKCIDEYGNTTELGINGFRAFRSYWQEHPERDQAWADQQREALGDERFRREMECEFIIDAETLIAPAKLLDLEPSEYVYKTGQVRWFSQPQKGKIYVVGLDPSLGTGGDPAAIQIFEAGNTQQIGEWTHNRTPIPEQVRILKDIVNHIHEITQDENSVYYSIENNTIGEAALISIHEMGEENIKGYFLSDTAVPTNGRRFRKGYNTTAKTKLTACSKLKNLIESGKMKIHSRALISELKTFISSGLSYAAKIGERDDLVMATVLVVRMLQTLQTYYSDLDRHLKDHDDVFIEPMPFIAMVR
jgi:hypothetical protein